MDGATPPRYPGLGGAIWLVLLLFTGALLGGTAVRLARLEEVAALQLAMTGAVPAAAVARYAWRRRGEPDSTLRVVPRVGPALVACLVVALLGFEILLYQAYATLTHLHPIPQKLLEELADRRDGPLLAMSLVIVLAAVAEEVLFRGVMLAGLLERYAPARAVVLSAAVFGLAHLLPWAILTSAAGGLLLGWLYYRTRSVVLCSVVHVAHNLASGAGLDQLGKLPGVVVWLDGSPTAPLLPLWLSGLGLLLAMVGFGLADRRLRTAPPHTRGVHRPFPPAP